MLFGIPLVAQHLYYFLHSKWHHKGIIATYCYYRICHGKWETIEIKHLLTESLPIHNDFVTTQIHGGVNVVLLSLIV